MSAEARLQGGNWPRGGGSGVEGGKGQSSRNPIGYWPWAAYRQWRMANFSSPRPPTLGPLRSALTPHSCRPDSPLQLQRAKENQHDQQKPIPRPDPSNDGPIWRSRRLVGRADPHIGGYIRSLRKL